MRKLELRPNSSGYTATPGNEIDSVQVDGGPSRSRRSFIGKPSTVNVGWMLDEQGFNYLTAFFRTATANGALPFLCDLLLDYANLEEYTCKFIPGSFKPVASTAAFTFNATAQFEVQPLQTNEEHDLDIIEYWEETYGRFDLAGRLSQVVNIILPETF